MALTITLAFDAPLRQPVHLDTEITSTPKTMIDCLHRPSAGQWSRYGLPVATCEAYSHTTSHTPIHTAVYAEAAECSITIMVSTGKRQKRWQHKRSLGCRDRAVT
eukprot:17744-Eustigmatos_ZCMA.PRE.1